MPSFDIVSEVDAQEVTNAVQSAKREIETRYDFKGVLADISHDKESVILHAADQTKLEAMQDILKVHFTRRKIDSKSLDMQKPEKATGNSVRQLIKIKQGVDSDTAKKIVKALKDSKLKAQSSIRGDVVRVDGKKRDDLQEAIALVKTLPLELPLQYINFRD
jgi:uncharacterized protein YajQ (UPF0234 family)